MALDFGIEIECLIPGVRNFISNVARGVAADITSAGLPCAFAGYTHARADQWKIVTDASLTAPTGYVGLELVSPPLNDSHLDQIDTVCNVVRGLHARTNRTCGLHVHIGARQLAFTTLKRLAFLYIENEDVIDSLMPPSRRGPAAGQGYCNTMKSVDFAALNRANTVQEIALAIRVENTRSNPTPSRYVKLNFSSYWRHGTVEFRQHSGTIDPVKIKRWVVFCQKLVDVAGIDRPITVPRPNQDAELARRIVRARQLRLIYEMVAREQGATSVEVQGILNRRTPPALASDLTRLGVRFRTDGRRDGHVVYKLMPNATEVATLSSLIEKLQLEQDDQEFWRARHLLLSNITNAVGEEGESGRNV